MRVPIAAARIGLAVTAVVVGLLGAALASGPFPHSDSVVTPELAPTPSSAHWWEDASHPPRTASARVRVSVDTAASTRALPPRVHADYEIVLQADDPLLVLVSEGGVTGRELVGRLLGGRLNDGGMPTVQRDATGPARVQISGTISPSYAISDDKRTRVPIPLESEDAEFYHPVPSSVVAHRSLTVEVTGMEIVAVSGVAVVRQSPTMVQFEGQPGATAVSVEVEHPEFIAASRSPSFAELVPSDIQDFLYSGLVVLAPWLALLLASWSNRRNGRIGTVSWRATFLVTVGGVLILAALYTFAMGSRLSGITVVSAAVLVASCGRALRGLPAWDECLQRRLLVGCTVLTATAGFIAWISLDVQLVPPSAELLGYLILVVAAAVLGAAWGRRFVLWGVASGLCAALLLAVSPVLTEYPLSSVSFLTMALALGLVCAYIAEAVALAPRLPHFRVARRLMLYSIVGLLFLPVLELADPILEERVISGPLDGLTVAVAVLNLVLVTVAVVLARQHGQHARGVGDVVVWRLALASLLVVVVDLGNLVQFNAVAAGSVLLFWWLLIPLHQRRRGIALAGVSPSTHTALVRAEMRRRLMELSAHDVYRSARALLRDGRISIREYQRRQQRLDDAGAIRGRVIAGVSVSDALATTGGRSPVDSTVAAMLYAAPLVVLIVGYELWALLSSEPWVLTGGPLWELLLLLAHILRWAAYAAIFGYFYPLIRGRTPVSKAMALILLILPPELLSVLSSIDPEGAPAVGRAITTSAELLLALAIRTGQVLVFFVVLGLAWERRLAMLAGYRWDRLRNIRSVRALATPAGTVIVAIATAMGTALAGTAVAALLTTGPTATPTPQPTPTPSQTR